MTNPDLPLEDLTKDELHDRFGTSTSQSKSQMIAEIQQTLITEGIDPAVQRAQEYRNS